jgi:hypothetical protein
MQSPGNRALLFVRGRCVMALRFVSSLLGEKDLHKNIGTAGPLSIQGGGEGPRAHGVTVGSGRDGLAAGSLFTAFAVCPTGCRPLSNPRSGELIPPAGVLHAKTKPAFSCELFFKYGGEGGIDSLRSPCGQPVRYALRLSNWLSPVVGPSVEGSHPSRRRATCEKKARIFMRALH